MAHSLVSIITGFLGSGKTTLLNKILRHPELTNSAVIINEFGEVGIDHLLVEKSDDNVVLLENGCLCCEMKGDLIDTLQDLHARKIAKKIPWFDRVLIETSGIADPGQVMQVILNDPLISSKYALGEVITTFDAENGLETLDRFPESVRQIAVADRIIVTKVDRLSEARLSIHLANIRVRIASLNPLAQIHTEILQEFDPLTILGGEMTSKNLATLGQLHDNNLKHHDHNSNIHTFCVVRDEPINLETLRLFLEAITKEAGPNMLRVKGIISVAERTEHPAIIQGAQRVFHSLKWLKSWPNEDRRTRIVFITHGIEQSHIEDSLNLIERITGANQRVSA